MKKKSRFLTGLLSAVMALSLFALPAAAAGDNANIVSTIDTSRKGTLTINKYEGKDEADAVDDKRLDGVTFTIYHVADIVQETDAAGVTQVKYDWLGGLKDKNIQLKVGTDSKTTYESIKDYLTNDVKNSLDSKTLTTGDEATGQKKGQVEFTNLDLGLYVVEETNAPSQILSYTAKFVVSIPMTNADGTGWEYHVTANPKNAAVYGGVNLKKYGKTLGIDKTSENTVGGAKFYLQKKVGDTWETVLNPEMGAGQVEDATKGLLTTNEAGEINITGLAPGDYRFIEYTGPDGYIADGEAAYTFKVVDDQTVTIPDAYKDTTANTIKVVNEKPDIEKTVKKSGTENYGKSADYSVGDTVTWKVEATIPTDVDKLKVFSLVDQMSNALDFDKDKCNLTVKADDVSLDSTIDFDFDVTPANTDNGTGPQWKIVFKPNGITKLKGKSKVTVTFDTTLNANAKPGDKDGIGNINDAQLNYSNGFYPETDPGDYPDQPKKPETDVIKNEATVYTFDMDITKVDGSTQNPLSGAKFILYRYNDDKTPSDNVTEDELKKNATVVREELVSGADGKLYDSKNKGKPLYFKNGKYYLVEIEAPTYAEGKHYNLLKAPVAVVLNVAYKGNTTTSVEKTENGDGTWTMKTTITSTTFDSANGNSTTGHFTVTVKNNKGFDLPTTGGFGTLLFSGIGALLVVGGVGVLMSTKKKKGNT